MKARYFNQYGFTLIELITVIAIVSILSVFVGTVVVNVVRGYAFSKENTAVTQRCQIAMQRMMKEFSSMKSISSAAQASIEYKQTSGETHKISLAGSDVKIDDDVLIGNVNSFSLVYYNYVYATKTLSPLPYSPSTKVVEVTLEIKGYEGTPLKFIDRVAI